MSRTPLLLLVGIILMIVAAIIPPVRYEAPQSIFVKSTFEEFRDELEDRNITNPDECLSLETLMVTCRIRNDWELNRTIESFNAFPHSSVELWDGYGEMEVIVLNKSLFYKTIPESCRYWGKTILKPDISNREKLEAELKAYRELEEVINNTSDRELIHNRTVDLEYLLGLRQKVPECNGTWASVVIMYPVKTESNSPIMTALWLGVMLIGAIGLVIVWRERN
ncbi:hypothetical protein A3L11_05865 [Thermococcus siculi]|uniref:Uncharacterized protein n=2 Tax=Thermococcus siculi TaxID=72803 RepID=A0A2Z2MMC3_9EURY|nr:hypothetical protein A3L11_05865 [Thermococcus siculi]